MRATVMYGAGDVRIETVADARVIEPTDALVAVTRACICGSDLWPYKTMELPCDERARVDQGHDRVLKGSAPTITLTVALGNYAKDRP